MSEPERDCERNSETYSEDGNERDDKRRRAQAAQIFDSAANKSDVKYSSKSSASSTVKQVISTRLKNRDDVVDSQGVFDSDSSSASPSHNTSTASSRGRRNRVSIYLIFNYDLNYSNIIGDTRTSVVIDIREWTIVY